MASFFPPETMQQLVLDENFKFGDVVNDIAKEIKKTYFTTYTLKSTHAAAVKLCTLLSKKVGYLAFERFRFVPSSQDVVCERKITFFSKEVQEARKAGHKVSPKRIDDPLLRAFFDMNYNASEMDKILEGVTEETLFKEHDRVSGKKRKIDK